jgi:hypothetical protein
MKHKSLLKQTTGVAKMTTLTKSEILVRRANAVARIAKIENGAPVTGNWHNAQHCINMNKTFIKTCDEQLEKLEQSA